MYYEKKKNNSFGIALIIIFLLIIIGILINLINKVDSNLNSSVLITEETGTDTVLNDFNIENLVENSSYSVVRSF